MEDEAYIERRNASAVEGVLSGDTRPMCEASKRCFKHAEWVLRRIDRKLGKIYASYCDRHARFHACGFDHIAHISLTARPNWRSPGSTPLSSNASTIGHNGKIEAQAQWMSTRDQHELFKWMDWPR